MANVYVEVQSSWGRRSKATWTASLGALFIIIFVVGWISTNFIALEYYGGSLRAVAQAVLKQGLVDFIVQHAPRGSVRATTGYLSWVVLQAFLYSYLPGKLCYGQLTPAGNLLQYTTNGLLAWTVTHAAFAAGSFTGLIDPAIIAKNWEGLLVAVNVYGLLLAAFCQIKAYVAPSHPQDRKFTGSIIFDYFCGIELNPRIGDWWDFKLFYNGRPGIIAWTLIDLSWMAYQYQTFGYVTKSMLLVNFFHFLYVLDFFYNEDWYLRTIDITHDHFGFTLAWGDVAFLPICTGFLGLLTTSQLVYTLQVQYLGRYPVHLSTPQAFVILAIGLSGYALFRAVNHQKDIVRSNKDALIWNKPAEYITCTYQTGDGKTHTSLLLTSGWWGFSRHTNYLADLMLSWAMCATCGMEKVLPWSYFFFMGTLLVHRLKRDEKRCATKYGKGWELYARKVRWKLIPGVW